jgi:hypothetical protein
MTSEPETNPPKFELLSTVICIFQNRSYMAKIINILSREDYAKLIGEARVKTMPELVQLLKDDVRKKQLLYCVHYVGWNSK